jgi:hypothetical protein
MGRGDPAYLRRNGVGIIVDELTKQTKKVWDSANSPYAWCKNDIIIEITADPYDCDDWHYFVGIPLEDEDGNPINCTKKLRLHAFKMLKSLGFRIKQNQVCKQTYTVQNQ